MKTVKKIIRAATTAVGPLDISKTNAIYIAIGGTAAPMIIEYKNTFTTLLASNNAVEAGIIKKAKVKTSPTNLVVSDIPTPTVK